MRTTSNCPIRTRKSHRHSIEQRNLCSRRGQTQGQCCHYTNTHTSQQLGRPRWLQAYIDGRHPVLVRHELSSADRNDRDRFLLRAARKLECPVGSSGAERTDWVNASHADLEAGSWARAQLFPLARTALDVGAGLFRFSRMRPTGQFRV